MKNDGRHRLRTWAWVHRWSSITSTVILLIAFITGLPLLFGDEIDALLTPSAHHASFSSHAARASIDPMVRTTEAAHPGEIVTGVFIDPDEPQVRVYTAVSRDAANADPASLHWLMFDAYTGSLLNDSRWVRLPYASIDQFFYTLHTRLLLGTTGAVIVAVTAILFLVAIVSGIVLYAPFMRRLPFGTVRKMRSARTRRLDTHNLFGIVTVAWAVVVGFTGGLNELADPLFAHWQQTVVANASPDKRPLLLRPRFSVQAAIEKAHAAVPRSIVTGIDYPGASFGNARDYMLWTRGDTPVTSRLFTPVLIDGDDGHLAAVLPMPWYLRAIEVSRPLHFGDYGGWPLKLIWAGFDLATIVVLVTGLRLFLRPKRIAP